ncbi:hypothetical protein [Chryseobacterium sp. ERMR1:04]|uniref:hypothetical protein n=1 Tax=Chryseobacterium sp. ERMR1:04 TaxID=1705393 RepID=UPI0006C83352|nr:hypothetical protein [Chryseobacterium sp. ERMR1:04]KPH14372.1 hypothetical protein AMQ68_02445 [Chryseobacterium sp. ERMR1:04]
MKNLSLLFILSIIIFSCKETKKDNDRYAHIPFLNELKETKNYEIVPIADWGEVKWDSIGKKIVIETEDEFYKYTADGIFKDSIKRDKILLIEDPYTFNSHRDNYTTWFYNDNKTLKKFIDILPYQLEDRDTLLYKKKHLEFYTKSSIVRYTDFGLYYYYYYYYKGDWYRMTSWGDRYIKKNYPEKLPPPRLKDIRIDGTPSFVKQFYVSTQKHKGSDALGSLGKFSTGFWVIRAGLPSGDSLVYRRLGDGLGNLTDFYQLPSSRGGMTVFCLFINNIIIVR